MTDLPLFSLPYGLMLKNAGKEAAANSYGSDEWLTKARVVASMLAVRNGETNASEVLKICPRPLGVAPNATGSLFRGKQWMLLGYLPTEKTSGRGRMIGRWALVS